MCVTYNFQHCPRGFTYTIHGSLNQEKSQKWCLDLGPIYLESITPEVFKTSFGKIPKTRPSETMAKNLFLEVTLLNKVNFFNSQSNFFTK